MKSVPAEELCRNKSRAQVFYSNERKICSRVFLNDVNSSTNVSWIGMTDTADKGLFLQQGFYAIFFCFCKFSEGTWTFYSTLIYLFHPSGGRHLLLNCYRQCNYHSPTCDHEALSCAFTASQNNPSLYVSRPGWHHCSHKEATSSNAFDFSEWRLSSNVRTWWEKVSQHVCIGTYSGQE